MRATGYRFRRRFPYPWPIPRNRCDNPTPLLASPSIQISPVKPQPAAILQNGIRGVHGIMGQRYRDPIGEI